MLSVPWDEGKWSRTESLRETAGNGNRQADRELKLTEKLFYLILIIAFIFLPPLSPSLHFLFLPHLSVSFSLLHFLPPSLPPFLPLCCLRSYVFYAHFAIEEIMTAGLRALIHDRFFVPHKERNPMTTGPSAPTTGLLFTTQDKCS